MSRFTHELNNLLTVIQGFTQLALERLEPSHPAARDLDEVVEAADKAIQLVAQHAGEESAISLVEPNKG